MSGSRSDITDQPYEVSHVKSVGDGSITMVDGWSIGCPLDGVQPGDAVELWGRGFGHQVRGLAVAGRVAWYRTEAEEEVHRLQQIRDMDDRKRQEFEAKRADLDAQFAALPSCFQERIQRFRVGGGPDWRWRFEAYEMMVCVDAVKIAEWCVANKMTIGAFAVLPWDEQKVAGIDGGHSGNSFSCAVYLARLWPNPDAVVAAHGALVPLVGCDAYGCTHVTVVG